MSQNATDLESAVRAALGKVIDPELRRPITEVGMVKNVTVDADAGVHVEIYLTTAACPKKNEISERVNHAVADVPGTGAVKVSLDVMNDEQRTELRKQLRGDSREPVIPFAQPGSLTKVYAVASGKGGVGKSSVTVNLAAAMATRGLSVGVLDADIYGHSVPRMMGTTERPTQVESMILPPVAHDVRVISIAMFTQGNTPVVWRGPMLHRALQQFLADVYWGDLDVLLLDLPPGTGDIAISVAQLIPGAEILVVTTPQLAAAEVAERAGAIALQTRQRIVGVVENMSGLLLPDGTTMQIFGEGGGRQVAESLTRAVGADVPLLGQVPLDPRWYRRAILVCRWCCQRAGFGGGQGIAQHRRRAVEPQAWAGRDVARAGPRRPLDGSAISISGERRYSGFPARHHQFRAMDSEQVIRIALTVVTPILTAGIGIVALVIGDWRERRTQHGRRKLAVEDAGRQVDVRRGLVQRQQADRRPPDAQQRAAARAQAWLDEAAELLAESKPAPPAEEKRSVTARRLLLAYPMHRRGARVLRGFYYFFLGMVVLQVSRGAGFRLRQNGHARHTQLLLGRADLRRPHRHLPVHAHRDGLSVLVAARGGISSHGRAEKPDDASARVAVVQVQRASRATLRAWSSTAGWRSPSWSQSRRC